MIHFAIAMCLVVLSWVVFYWWPRRHVWALAKKVPGPPGYPVIGCTYLLNLKVKECIPTIRKLFDEYGSVVRVWIGTDVRFIIKDPEDIQQVLGSPKVKNKDWRVTKAFSTCSGENLMTLRGDQWKTHRKLITPLFQFKILETYADVFGRKSTILVEKLKEFEGKSFNVYNILALCTLDAICETAIGTAVNCLANGRSPLSDYLHEAQHYIFNRFFRPWLLIDFVYALTPESRRAKRVKKALDEFSENVIAQKLAEYRRGVRSVTSSFLDMLIAASEAENSILSPEEIRDEVALLAAAGMETSATTMSFLLILVALHPEIQAEIHEELDKVFGDDSRSATSQDLQQLCVMERCLKETLRLFPTGGFLPREIDEDVHLPSGYVLPANSCVGILSIVTHRDARNFSEPDKFRPGRWLPENSEKTHPYAYLPFSAGPRNCVGQKYAKLQMKSILSQILRRYRVTTPLTMQDLDYLEICVTLRMNTEMKNRYHIQLHQR